MNTSKGLCVIGAVSWAEVLSRLAEEGRESDETVRQLVNRGILQESVVIHPLGKAPALEIAKLRPATREAGRSLAARACLALAKTLDLPALTADRAWTTIR